jgi:hypothetical protein
VFGTAVLVAEAIAGDEEDPIGKEMTQ